MVIPMKGELTGGFRRQTRMGGSMGITNGRIWVLEVVLGG